MPFPDHVHARPGPALLAGIERGPSLAAHRKQYGEPPDVSRTSCTRPCAGSPAGPRSAGFPFATKLEAVLQQRSRPVLVVNMSEGEPASSNDTASR